MYSFRLRSDVIYTGVCWSSNAGQTDGQQVMGGLVLEEVHLVQAGARVPRPRLLRDEDLAAVEGPVSEEPRDNAAPLQGRAEDRGFVFVDTEVNECNVQK